MATATVAGFLDINNGGSVFDQLALKVYAGQVLEAYTKACVTEGRHLQRTISSGKSAQFPATGLATASFHTRGTELSFQSMNSNERVITIQDLMVAPIFLDILDEAKSHFDIRRPYATQQGSALAVQADLRVLMSCIAAAKTGTPTVTGLPGGTSTANAAINTDASILTAGIYAAAQKLDENNIPATERFCYLAPAQYNLLLQDGEFIDRDFNDANGNRARAYLRNAADFELVKTNNLPRSDYSADSNFLTDLKKDYSTNVAVCCHMSAAGSVTLIGLQFESEYDMNRQGWMLVAKYAKGFSYLRPEAAHELKTS